MVVLGRLFTAMVTPMRADGTVDMEQAKRLATALLDSGSDGLVVCGTTGEASTLEFEEERTLFQELLPICHSRGAALVAGTGSNSTRTAIESSRRAEEIGVDALLLVVPYYNKPSQEGMYQHFRTVAEAVSTPCILYNVPSRTSINMAAETQLRLARDVRNIVGTKEASGDLEAIGAIIDGAPHGFRVWSGNDSDTLPMLALGSHGVISVTSHLVGRQLRHDDRRLLCRRSGRSRADPSQPDRANQGDVPGRQPGAGEVCPQSGGLPCGPHAAAAGGAG